MKRHIASIAATAADIARAFEELLVDCETYVSQSVTATGGVYLPAGV